MSHLKELFVGDVGVIIQLAVVDSAGAAVDLSTATTMQIKIKAPDNTVVVKTATHVTDGTDGLMKAATEVGDLSQEGRHHFQGYVVDPTGEFHTQRDQFMVRPIIEVLS